MKASLIRLCLIFFGFVFLIWFLIPLVFYSLLNIGNSTGIIISVCLLFYGLFFSKINILIKNIFKSTIGKILLSLLIVILSCIIIMALTATIMMIKACNTLPSKNSTALVLGCRVYGSRPSLMLTERLDATVKYLSDNPESVCVLSGGQGPGENISEAESMNQYLVKKGIDKSRIYKEQQSTSTRENIAFSEKIINQNGLNNNITIITNEFHQYRASRIAKRLNINPAAYSGRTAWWLFPTYYVRELYGIVFEWVF